MSTATFTKPVPARFTQLTAVQLASLYANGGMDAVRESGLFREFSDEAIRQKLSSLGMIGLDPTHTEAVDDYVVLVRGSHHPELMAKHTVSMLRKAGLLPAMGKKVEPQD